MNDERLDAVVEQELSNADASETGASEEMRPSDGGSDGASGGADAPKSKKAKGRGARKKGIIAACVVVIVIVVAGAGFWVWHEQPSFCNAICHSPMDEYVEGYLSEDTTLLSAYHASQDVTCLDCHEPTLTEQVSEAICWITGSYSVPLETYDFATSEFCFRCHDSDSIKEATADYGGDEGVNPHSSHYSSELECGDCHSVHGTSTLYCNQCHNLDLPEGWE